MLQPHRSLRLGAALIAAALAGWLGSSSMASRQAAVTSGSVTDPQETELLSRFERGELSEHEHRRLLERLLARERFDAAQQVLQPLLDRHPEQPHWREINVSVISHGLVRAKTSYSKLRGLTKKKV